MLKEAEEQRLEALAAAGHNIVSHNLCATIMCADFKQVVDISVTTCVLQLWVHISNVYNQLTASLFSELLRTLFFLSSLLENKECKFGWK